MREFKYLPLETAGLKGAFLYLTLTVKACLDFQEVRYSCVQVFFFLLPGNICVDYSLLFVSYYL